MDYQQNMTYQSLVRMLINPIAPEIRAIVLQRLTEFNNQLLEDTPKKPIPEVDLDDIQGFNDKAPLYDKRENARRNRACAMTNAMTNVMTTELLVVYTHEYGQTRFADYCGIYGVTHIATTPNDAYDNVAASSASIIMVLFETALILANPMEILEKYHHSSSLVVMATDVVGGVIGKRDLIMELLKGDTSTIAIETDTSNTFFLNVDRDDVEIDYKISRVKTGVTYPCVVYADATGYRYLNYYENYTGNGWNQYYGYCGKTIRFKTPMIYLSCVTPPKLRYPVESLVVTLHERLDETTLRYDIKRFLESECQYYFVIDPHYVVTNEAVLVDLLSHDRDVTAPLFKKVNSVWSNFWGSLDENGFYERSTDYLDIVGYERRGCWNVPYVTGVMLIKRSVIEKVPNVLELNEELDWDMRICHNWRANGIYQYVVNLDKYGYIRDKLTDKVTIYDVFDNEAEWQNRYLHPDFLAVFENIEMLKYQEVCPDIYKFSLFTEEFCQELIATAEKFGKWSQGKDAHYDPRLGGSNYENVPTVDIHLNQLGLDKHWDKIVKDYLTPVVALVYSTYQLKGAHLTFIVKYDCERQSELRRHHDSGCVTINIALNRDYTGGGCHFVRQEVTVTNQEVGSALLHPAKLTAYHEGVKITSGVRYILVSFMN